MRVALATFGLSPRDADRQPWRWQLDLVRGLLERDHEVRVLTDGPGAPGLDVERVALRRKEAVQAALSRFRPDVTLLSASTATLAMAGLAGGPPRGGLTLGLVPGPLPSPGMWSGLRATDALDAARLVGAQLAQRAAPHALVRRGIARFDGLVLSSSTDLRALRTLDPVAPAVVLPQGLRDAGAGSAERSVRGASQDPRVAFFGPAYGLRGADTLVDAANMPILRERRAIVDLLVRGAEGEDATALRRLERRAATLLGEGRARIVPRSMPRGELEAALRASDLVALPFRALQSAVPVSVLEAMALGVPVVSTRVGCVPELLADGRGAIVPPGDAGSLARAIAAWIDAPEVAREAAKRARAHVATLPTPRENAVALERFVGALP